MSLSDPTLVHETHQAAVCFALLFGFNVFTSGTQRVFAGLQLSVLGHLASLLGSLLSCLGLWWASGAQPGITGLLVIMLGGQSCASVLLLGVLVARHQVGLTGMAHALAIESPHLLKTGGLFLLLQIGTMIGWGADNLIISTTLGVAQVAVFSVVQRLFQLISQPLGILNAPLWGAYADAHARNDRQFIRKTLTRSFFVTIVGAILGAGLLLTAHAWLIEKWTHAKIEAPWPFVALYAIWVVFDACGNAFAMFLNGTGIVKQQVGVIMSFVVLVLPLKLLLIQVMGLQALPIATLVAYLATHVCLYGLVHRKDIAKNVSTAPI